jgi:hypothetical protein
MPHVEELLKLDLPALRDRPVEKSRLILALKVGEPEALHLEPQPAPRSAYSVLLVQEASVRDDHHPGRPQRGAAADGAAFERWLIPFFATVHLQLSKRVNLPLGKTHATQFIIIPFNVQLNNLRIDAPCIHPLEE